MDKVKSSSVTKRMSLFGWILASLFIIVTAVFGALSFKYSSSSGGSDFSFQGDNLVYYDDGTVSIENDYSKNIIKTEDEFSYVVTAFDKNGQNRICDELYLYKSLPTNSEQGLLGYYRSLPSDYINGELSVYAEKLKLHIDGYAGSFNQEYEYKKSGAYLKSYITPPFDLKINEDGSIDFSVTSNGNTHAYSFPLDAKASEDQYVVTEGFETITLSLYETRFSLSVTSSFLSLMAFLSEAEFVISTIGAASILLIQLATIAVKKDYKIRAKSLVNGWIGAIASAVLVIAGVAVPLTSSGFSFTPFDPFVVISPALGLLLFVFSLFFLIDTNKKGKAIKEARKAYLIDYHQQKEIEKQELKAKNEEIKAKKQEEKRLEEARKAEERRLDEIRKAAEKEKLAAEQKERKIALDKQKEETRVIKEAEAKEKAKAKQEKLKKSFALRPLYFVGPSLALTIFSMVLALQSSDNLGYFVLIVFPLLIATSVVAIVGAFNYNKMKKMFFVYSILLFISTLLLGLGGFGVLRGGFNFSTEGVHPFFWIAEVVVLCSFIAFFVTRSLVKDDKKKTIAGISILGGAFFLMFASIEAMNLISSQYYPELMGPSILAIVILPLICASLYFVYLSLTRPISEAEIATAKKREQRRLEAKEEKRLEKEYDGMNKEFNLAIKNKDFDKAKELETRIKQYEQQHGLQKASYFDGGLLSYFGWKFLGNLLTLITFGIAYPWAVCFIKRWEVKHTVIASRRLLFTGTGGKLFVKYIVWWLLSIVTLGIYALFVPLKMEKWVASHTFDAPLEKIEHVKRLEDEANRATTNHDVDGVERLTKELDEYKKENDILGESYFDGKLLQLIGWNLLCFLVNLITLGIAIPFTTCWMMKWKAKHQVILGRRLSFDGNGLQLIGRYLIWLLLTVITLGIYGLWLNIKMKKWETKHLHFEKESSEESK